jgi:hypothetical protein
MIVKNFPDEYEIQNALAGFAEDIRYTRLPAEEHWEVVYRVKSKVPTAGEK